MQSLERKACIQMSEGALDYLGDLDVYAEHVLHEEVHCCFFVLIEVTCNHFVFVLFLVRIACSLSFNPFFQLQTLDKQRISLARNTSTIPPTLSAYLPWRIHSGTRLPCPF